MVFSKQDSAQLREYFDEHLQAPVKLLVFSQSMRLPEDPLPIQHELCADAVEVMSEIADHSEHIDIQIAQFDQHRDLAAKYHIEQVPAIVVLPQDESQPDPGLRFYGLPSHYEFLTFLDVLSGLSRNEADLQPGTLKSLEKLEHNVHIKVFYTQNCALCPMVTHLAYQFALASDKVFTESLDASEFPQYAEFYNVRGVPYIIVNEKLRKVGVRSEGDFLKLIHESVSKPCPVMVSA